MSSFFGEKDNTQKEENANWEDFEHVEKNENWDDEMDIEAGGCMLEEGDEDGEREWEKENENDDKEEKKMKGTGKIYQVLNFK